VEMPHFTKNDESLHFSSKLTFDNKEQYDLFMFYLKQTKINTMREEPNGDQSLADFYLQKSDEKQSEVILHNKWGTASVVSKFMEVTRMMEMDYTKHMIFGYEPDTDPSYLPLARQGDATIDNDTIQRMQQYREQHSITKKTKPSIEVTAEEMGKTIKQTLSQYEAHLRQKLLNERVLNNIESEINIDVIRQGTLTTKQQKLLNRYEAINTVYKDIKDKSSLDNKDYLVVKTAVETCQNNKPAWSERSFLQKFTDLLSLGLKPLYRSFFSKEKQIKEELHERSFPAPK
jgi:hypothetical protein